MRASDAKFTASLYHSDPELALHPLRAVTGRTMRCAAIGLLLSPLAIVPIVGAVLLAVAFPGIPPEAFGVACAVVILAGCALIALRVSDPAR